MSQGLFEEDYFQNVYQGKYLLRNPSYKWRGFLRQILKYRQQGDLLDIGCAAGLFLEQACRYFNCTGCDVSTYALSQANIRLSNTARLLQGNLGEIHSDQTYDIITCFDVIEHVPDLQKGLTNIYDLLKPKGLLVITVPVYDGLFGNLVDRLDRDITHIHRKSRAFWLELIQTRFSLLAYLGIWRYFFMGRFYINIVSLYSRQWTTAIMLISEKP